MPVEVLNCLSLWPRHLFERKQSPSRRFTLRALAARSDVRLHQSGPGFSDWDNDASGVANIHRIMPECDAILSYKAMAGCEYGKVNDPLEVSKLCLTIERANECWPGTDPRFGQVMHPGGGTIADECRKGGIRLLVIHHANDYERVKSIEDYGAKIVHIPHAADPVFLEESRPWSEREGVILTGSIGQDHYVLRTRWRSLIQRGRIPGREFVRPGNYTRSVEESDALVRDYARALGSCRVKLGCSSIWRYQLQHFSEAALAGCAHVADMPEGVAPDFARMIFRVPPDAPDHVLIEAVEYALANAETIGKQAQETARAAYTTAHYAEKLVAEIRKML